MLLGRIIFYQSQIASVLPTNRPDSPMTLNADIMGSPNVQNSNVWVSGSDVIADTGDDPTERQSIQDNAPNSEGVLLMVEMGFSRQLALAALEVSNFLTSFYVV